MKELLKNVYNNGHTVSCKNQKICATPTFYYAIHDLAKKGFMEPVQGHKSGQDKSWKITEKGIAFIKLILETDKMTSMEGLD